MDCLPQVPDDSKWRIPEEEFEKRRDFRQECVFTIDPVTARDLDDALHVIDLGNGQWSRVNYTYLLFCSFLLACSNLKFFLCVQKKPIHDCRFFRNHSFTPRSRT